MKNFTLLFTAILLNMAALAQAPAGINYQTVIRDGDGNILPNTELSLQMSIRSGATDGEVVYAETHEVSTNAFGLANMVIGNGTAQIGTFAGIDWSAGEKYLETAIDQAGTGNYNVLGVTQLLSVPYALESKHASSMTLMDVNGNEYEISIDTLGNLYANIIETEYSCGQIFTDTRDGKEYQTVLIGDQCWMAENLNIGTRLNGISNQTNNSEIEKYCYNDLEANCDTYGGLYQWNEMMQYVTTEGVHGICPGEWRIPTDAEWSALATYLGGGIVAGGKLKESGTSHWNSPNTGATNSSGFTGLPGASRKYNGVFDYLGNYGYFWSSTETTRLTYAWIRRLAYNNGTANAGSSSDKVQGFSVRCLRDIEQQNLPPESPSSPIPENETQNQGIETGLFWTCSDPNDDPLTYDVFFGIEATPAQVTTGQSETTFDPGTLEYNTQYFWQIVAHDNQGNTTEGEVWSFTTEAEPVGFSCGDVFTDARDGQTYETVQIGTQCWMAENLAYLPAVSPSSEGSETDPFYYVGDYQGTNVSEAKTSDNYQNYGVLFNWPASLAACPTNWHLPTDAEWTDLTTYLGGEGVAGGKMKSTRTEPDSQPCWKSPNTGATNSSDFTGLPGGFRDKNGVFVYCGSYVAILWSSTANLNGNSWGRLLASYEANVTRNNYAKRSGFSVRCLRD